MSYALIVLFSAAITVVFTEGEIFAPVRRVGPSFWRALASCPLCSGVWVGALSAAAVLGIAPTWRFDSIFLLLGLGSAAGCCALLFVRFWGALEAYEVRAELEAQEISLEIKRQLADAEDEGEQE